MKKSILFTLFTLVVLIGCSKDPMDPTVETVYETKYNYTILTNFVIQTNYDIQTNWTYLTNWSDLTNFVVETNQEYITNWFYMTNWTEMTNIVVIRKRIKKITDQLDSGRYYTFSYNAGSTNLNIQTYYLNNSFSTALTYKYDNTGTLTNVTIGSRNYICYSTIYTTFSANEYSVCYYFTNIENAYIDYISNYYYNGNLSECIKLFKDRFNCSFKYYYDDVDICYDRTQLGWVDLGVLDWLNQYFDAEWEEYTI